MKLTTTLNPSEHNQNCLCYWNGATAMVNLLGRMVTDMAKALDSGELASEPEERPQMNLALCMVACMLDEVQQKHALNCPREGGAAPLAQRSAMHILQLHSLAFYLKLILSNSSNPQLRRP